MDRERYSDEDVLRLLRENELSRAEGLSFVMSACRKAGVSDPANYNWRKKFGDVSKLNASNRHAPRKVDSPHI